MNIDPHFAPPTRHEFIVKPVDLFWWAFYATCGVAGGLIAAFTAYMAVFSAVALFVGT